jgi:predicted transposase/invertase (TIGR01784 family)
VEMQKAKINFFKDRSLFYVTFPIREQAVKGEWDFNLSPIYFIAILDFLYDEKLEKAKFLRNVYLTDQDCEIFYEKLNFKFIQMPAFNKAEADLKTHFDKWIYFLKNLENLDGIPAILKEPIFEKAFETTRIAGFTPKERIEYEQSRLTYLEVKAALDTAEQDGMHKKSIEIAKKLINRGISDEFIAEDTGLSIAQVQALRK